MGLSSEVAAADPPLLVDVAMQTLLDRANQALGRVGRLPITLLLSSQGMMSRPLLYLSLYFKRHREDYYAHLQRVRTEGDWEGWLGFFLEGVIEVAESTTHTTRRLVAMIESDRRTIHSFGRGAATAHRVHDLTARFIVLGASSAAEQLELTSPPVYAAIDRLERGGGILREATGRRRGKLYVYDKYLCSMTCAAHRTWRAPAQRASGLTPWLREPGNGKDCSFLAS